MSGDAVFGKGEGLPGGGGVDEGEGVVLLVGDEEGAGLGECGGKGEGEGEREQVGGEGTNLHRPRVYMFASAGGKVRPLSFWVWLRRATARCGDDAVWGRLV